MRVSIARVYSLFCLYCSHTCAQQRDFADAAHSKSAKICCQNCIVRNFQFRKFLPVNSYPLSFIPSARQNVNEIFLIKIALFCTVKAPALQAGPALFTRYRLLVVNRYRKIPAENLGQFVTECNASRNFE